MQILLLQGRRESRPDNNFASLERDANLIVERRRKSQAIRRRREFCVSNNEREFCIFNQRCKIRVSHSALEDFQPSMAFEDAKEVNSSRVLSRDLKEYWTKRETLLDATLKSSSRSCFLTAIATNAGPIIKHSRLCQEKMSTQEEVGFRYYFQHGRT